MSPNTSGSCCIPTFDGDAEFNTPVSMRAKMKVTEVIRRENHDVLTMKPVCKSGSYPADGTDEDNTFSKFTPTGSLELTVANPALIGQFAPGDTYYLDFTKVEKAD